MFTILYKFDNKRVIMENYFDYIIIGSGAGGGTIAKIVAEAGKQILILERGNFLPQEKENWDSEAVFMENRYHTSETWKDKDNIDFHPGTGYWVGGNTKVFGAALFRLREKDFEELQYPDGISPEWPLKYKDFEPFYDKAEQLFDVHGKAFIDPTEPHRSIDFPYPAVKDEDNIAKIRQSLQNYGLQPFDIPLGIKLNEADRKNSLCLKCNTCDGYPCMVHAKADSDINCIRKIQNLPNVTLKINAHVERLLTDTSGNKITGVETTIDDQKQIFSAETVIVSCGAINSAALLLRSANEHHPNGLSNKNGLVGRNFMKHKNAAMLAMTFHENPTKFQKTFAVHDFYFGDEEHDFPLGSIQLMGKSDKYNVKAESPVPGVPLLVTDEMAKHSVDWWFTTEDLPSSENRVLWKDNQIHLLYYENNEKPFQLLIQKFSKILKEIGDHVGFIPESLNISKRIDITGVAHQVGTLRFGIDPETSVLDIHCKTHEIDNLYVVDGSFFPSSGAVNPSLTIIANAIRVGEYLLTQ